MACFGSFADAQVTAVSPPAQPVTWTLIAPPDGSFKVLIPCSQAEIAAALNADHSRALLSVGCKKAEYSAVAVSMPGAPPQFFESQVRTTKKNRIPPEQLNGHRTVRWRNIPKGGVGETMGQLVEIGASNYLLLSFEQKTQVTGESHAVAEQFFNSVEVSQK
jgi:hypothetical protein